jgi:hypothetical protein
MTGEHSPRPTFRPPALGHSARLGASRREVFLVMAHLVVLALAFEDEEIADALIDWFGWSGDFAAIARRGVIAAILALWGALTLAWVRCRRIES